jgi:uncharacterized protein YacL
MSNKPNPSKRNTASPDASPQGSSGSGQSAHSPNITTTDPGIEKYRIERAYRLGLVGFIASILLALILAAFTLFGFKEAQGVAIIVSPFLSVLGTLVGVFFGVQVGSAGREEAQQQAKDANNKVTAFAAMADPTKIQSAIDAYTRLSSGK